MDMKKLRSHIQDPSTSIRRNLLLAKLKGIQGGYLSFQALGGDHRGLWIDIPKILIYGHNPQSVPLAAARRLKLEDPRVVKNTTTNAMHTP